MSLPKAWSHESPLLFLVVLAVGEGGHLQFSPLGIGSNQPFLEKDRAKGKQDNQRKEGRCKGRGSGSAHRRQPGVRTVA